MSNTITAAKEFTAALHRPTAQAAAAAAIAATAAAAKAATTATAAKVAAASPSFTHPHKLAAPGPAPGGKAGASAAGAPAAATLAATRVATAASKAGSNVAKCHPGRACPPILSAHAMKILAMDAARRVNGTYLKQGK